MGSVMVVQVALFCLITAVMSQQPVGLKKYYSADCGDAYNCTKHSGKCEEGYKHDELGKCTKCPGPGNFCESCCYPPNYRCDGNTCVCARNCRYTESFILAAQVALGAALTLAFLALAALFWRSCQGRNGSRPRYLSSRHERQSSLTSVQRFVLQRLRDRPPRYEDTNQIQLEKPPAYQEAVTDSAVS